MPRGGDRSSIDLSGHAPGEYGRWTVVERDAEKSGKGKGVWWICRCACGTVKSVMGGQLVAGRSAGCRACHTAQQHASGSLASHVADLSRPVWTGVCRTCGAEYLGTVRQVYCSPACRPKK